MSQMVSEQLERRLVEHLDGELGETEQVDLYRELLRNQELRGLMDRYAEADRLASEALAQLIDLPHRPVKVETTRRRIPWAQLMATAAMVLIAVALWGAMRAVLPIVNSTNNATDTDPTRGMAVSPAPVPAPTPDVAVNDNVQIEHALLVVPGDAAAQPWWRSRPAPVSNGRLIDTAASRPLIDGVQHGRRTNDKALIGVLDEDAERFYWFEVDHQQTVVESVTGEL